MSSKSQSRRNGDSSPNPPVHLSEEDLKRIISEARKRPRWYDLGAFAAVLTLAVFLLYEASSSSTEAVSSKLDATSKEIISRLDGLERDTQKYDPIFRNTLLAQARSVLHSVRVTDIENQSIQSRLEEIVVSLDRSGTFKDSGHGWLMLLTLLVRDVPKTLGHVPYAGKPYNDRLEILKSWTPIANTDREIGVVEQCYLDTFSALLRLKELLSSTAHVAASEGVSLSDPLVEVFERLARVTRMCPDLPNAHNGLGVYWLEMAGMTGNSAQFDVAQTHFNYAYHMGIFNSADRGVVLGTYVNNSASLKLARAYMSSLPSKRVDGDWYFSNLPGASKLLAVSDSLEKALLELESAEDITASTAIHFLTKAETNMVLALLDRAYRHPDIPVSFDVQDARLARALEYLRRAKYHGFEDWCYFFSKDWVKLTVLATPGLSKQISDWCTF